jgi:hypothetical protein
MSDLKEIKELLDSMIPGEPIPNDVWETQDGRRIHISEMSDKHLVNTLLYLKRKTKNSIIQLAAKTNWDSVKDRWRDLLPPKIKAKFDLMEAEAIKRGFTNWESKHPVRE